MAVMNTYNYSKPKSFFKVDINTPTANKANGSNLATVAKTKPNPSSRSTQYLEAQVMAAKPEELTYMLYNGLVRFIKKAMISLEGKDIESVNYNTKRAQDILSELRSSLNMSIPISTDLDALYEYTEFKLFEANVQKENSMFKEALYMAEEFRDTWRKAFNLA